MELRHRRVPRPVPHDGGRRHLSVAPQVHSLQCPLSSRQPGEGEGRPVIRDKPRDGGAAAEREAE